MGFPKTLPWSHMNSKGEYKLKENIEDPDLYAFYEKDVGFGFQHGIRIDAMQHKDKKEKTIIRVKTLSGNSWGKGAWLIIRADYYLTMQWALDALQGKTETPKGKRKPRPIEPMSNQEVEAWCKEA